MTAVTPGPAALLFASADPGPPGPALTASPGAGRLIGLLFVVAVVLFLVAVVTL